MSRKILGWKTGSLVNLDSILWLGKYEDLVQDPESNLAGSCIFRILKDPFTNSQGMIRIETRVCCCHRSRHTLILAILFENGDASQMFLGI
jgi:hypothetical protein